VVDALVAHAADESSANKDQTSFWRNKNRLDELGLDGIVALTKFFVLEWSQELDYQLYHELPTALYVG